MKVYVDGLERSGNVFLSNAIGSTLGVMVDSKKTHYIHTLKEYKKDYPFVVPVRDALPSIVSAKIFRDRVFATQLYVDNEARNSFLENIIKRYDEYIQYLVDHPEFFIAPFHVFTKDHNLVIDALVKMHPKLKRVKTLTSKEIIDKAIDSDPQSLDSYLGNFPRQHVEEKKDIEQTILKNHSEEISQIQEKIQLLYKRFDSYSKDMVYNEFMENTTNIDRSDLQLCCDGCTCTNSHSSKPTD
jgi:hypothetical protein